MMRQLAYSLISRTVKNENLVVQTDKALRKQQLLHTHNAMDSGNETEYAATKKRQDQALFHGEPGLFKRWCNLRKLFSCHCLHICSFSSICTHSCPFYLLDGERDRRREVR